MTVTETEDRAPADGGPRDHDRALVLSGGNALGAYQAGVYAALHDAAWEPDIVVGASVGAVNGAVICGTPRDERLDRLATLWRPAPGEGPAAGAAETLRRTTAAAWTMLAGRPELFVPRNLFGPWWNPFGSGDPASLYDAHPLAATLSGLVDFDLLNAGAPRYGATAVDVESGEDVVFDTDRHRLTADHVRASAALLPLFAPVEIEGRLLGDAGISANLPLDVVLDAPRDRPLVCLAIDLLPLAGARPRDLGEVAIRTQDLIFATQSRRAIAAWQAIFDARRDGGDPRSVTLVHLAYADPTREVSGKAFDFSPETAAARWRAGRRDGEALVADLASGAIGTGAPGLTVHRVHGGAPASALAPVPA